MGRFLIFFSYLGTRYCGLQQQTGVLVKGQPIKTVGGALEKALKRLRPSNEIKLTLSSRTDKGVHALKNACHVDLEYPWPGKEYNPLVITNVMNNHLMHHEEDVRVLQTKQVPDTFHSRFSARGRKYVYRLGHVLESGVKSGLHDQPYSSESFYEEMMKFADKTPGRHPPFGELVSTLDSCKAVIFRTPLDISKLVSAAEMVSGIHNFLSFTSRIGRNNDHVPHPMKMLAIGVKRGQPFGHGLQKYGLDVAENIEFWDIHVQSRSFLYRQVRRLVGAMVLVAKNIITFDDLRNILDNPQKDFPFSGRMVADHAGLFLLDVVYDPKDLEFAQTIAADAMNDMQQKTPLFDTEDVSSSCIRSHQDERISQPSLRDQDNDADDRENGLSSDDDDLTSTVPSEKIHSELLEPSGCSEEISKHN